MGFRDSFAGALVRASQFVSKNHSTNEGVRPSLSQLYMSTDTGAKLPIFPFPMVMIKELANTVDALRIPIETLNREMFKNGFEVKERFKWKCGDCGKEFEYAPVKNGSDADEAISVEDEANMKKDVLMCDTCGGNNLIRPEPRHRKRLETLMTEQVNDNLQTLEEVMRMIEMDLEIYDSAYLLTMPSYEISDQDGRIVNISYKEFLRVDPPQVAMIADTDGRLGFDDNGREILVCPDFKHRENRMSRKDRDEIVKCPICQAQAIPAWFEVNTVYGLGVPNPKRVVYAKGEILFKAGKYSPNLLYGYSPIYTIWQKAMALSHMDEYIRKYFDKQRPPKGMLILNSKNYDGLKKSWDALQDKAMEDPYSINPLIVESERGGKGNLAQWINLTGELKDLEFTTVRRELRMIIGAMYGVLPLYFGELPTGWSQEGLQVTITNRAVKWGQDILYKQFFKPIASLLNIHDWDLKLKAGEETDKLRELQIQGVEIENMRAMKELGFEISRTHTGEFKVSKDPVLTLKDQVEAQRNDYENYPGEGLKPGGRGRSSAAPKEEAQRFEGQPGASRPGTEGGKQGDPRGAGRGTQIKMAFPKGINATNYEMVKSTLQTSLDFGWTKGKTVDELRKFGISVRNARDIVKSEFDGMRQWEGENDEEVS
jgi:DNA-directed RNA polymerase subunit RPC12/RpoP